MSRADRSKKYNALYIKIDSEVKCSIILDTLDLLFQSLRSSHREMFYKLGVLERFAKFTGRHLCQLSAYNFIKKETLAQVFSCKFCETFKNTLFIEHLWTIASRALLEVMMTFFSQTLSFFFIQVFTAFSNVFF